MQAVLKSCTAITLVLAFGSQAVAAGIALVPNPLGRPASAELHLFFEDGTTTGNDLGATRHDTGRSHAQADLVLVPGCGLPAAGDQSPDDARDPLGDVTDRRRWL